MEELVIGIVAIAAFAFMLSMIVLCLILSIKHKDFTIYLKTELLVYDMLQEISIIIFCFVIPSPLSKGFSYTKALNQTQFIYPRFIHSIQIFYMGWVLYKAITQKHIVSNKGIMIFTIISNLLALGITFGYYILLIMFPDSYDAIFTVFYFIFLDIPSIFIVFPLILFYYHIRKTLKQEFLLIIPIAQQKRAIAKQLIFYPIIYMIHVCIYLLAVFTLFIELDSITANIMIDVIFCMYPMMNSIVYGISNSTKRYMYAICLRDKEYEEIEEAEHELRSENLLAPRVYSDFINNQS
jgi:hypothetical protein